jgi:hypothetical protein
MSSARPPHKQICSKPLREAPLDLASESNESDTFPFYTSPTLALTFQVYFLCRDKFDWDYCFVCDDGQPSEPVTDQAGPHFSKRAKRCLSSGVTP